MDNSAVRFNPIDYTETTTAMLAALTVEWASISHRALALEAADPVAMITCGYIMSETAMAWDRRRGLGGVTPWEAEADAGVWLDQHPDVPVVRDRLVQWVRSTAAVNEPMLALLDQIGWS